MKFKDGLLVAVSLAAVCAPFRSAWSQPATQPQAATASAPASSQRVRTVADLTTPQPDMIEGLAVDKAGNIYVGILSGTIVKIAPDGSRSTLTTFDFDHKAGGRPMIIGLAVDEQGSVYAVLLTHNRPGTPTHGVWRIRPDGSKELAGAVPDAAGDVNQVTLDRRGNIYITDSNLGIIWRVTTGSTVATAWFKDPRILPAHKAGNPCNVDPAIRSGVNGIAFDSRGDLFVSSAGQGLILHVAIDPKTGAPKEVSEYAKDCGELTALDQMAVDVQGNVYAARNVAQKVVRVTPQKKVETLATMADGLAFPVNIAFGPKVPSQGSGARTRDQLYITNLRTRTLLAIDVGIPGLPMP